MKLIETLSQWFGLRRLSVHPRTSYGGIASRRPPNLQKICEDMGEEVSSEAVEFLASRGLSEGQIEELLCATNTLEGPATDDLDAQVDKMFAESTLNKYGYRGVDQFMQELIQRRETKR